MLTVPEYSKDALGRAVRALRERSGKTQEELGREAGYGSGAGVSISRLENGLLRPGSEKLAGIASALGLGPDELEAQAMAQEVQDGQRRGASDADRDSASERARSGSRDLKERAKRIQRVIDERTAVIKKLSEEFNEQHDRASDEFFMRFVELAAQIEGAPEIHPADLDDDDAADADAVAAYRLKANANGIGKLLAGGAGGAAAGAAVGSAAAYGAFVAAASFGTASTGAAISGLTGVAATNATLALLGGGTLAAGGAGMAGGTMVLAGIVAAPAAILFAGGLLWMAKRNRRQQEELAAQLDEAEAELAATETGFRALKEILPRASETLDYIATHGGHALERWKQQLGPGSATWESLGAAEQERYQSFIDIAAAQLTIVTINVQGVLTTRGDDRDRLIRLADEVLTQSRDTVRAHV